MSSYLPDSQQHDDCNDMRASPRYQDSREEGLLGHRSRPELSSWTRGAEGECHLSNKSAARREGVAADLVVAVFLEGLHVVVDVLGGEVPEAAAQRHIHAGVQQPRQPQHHLLHALQHWPSLQTQHPSVMAKHSIDHR